MILKFGYFLGEQNINKHHIFDLSTLDNVTSLKSLHSSRVFFSFGFAPNKNMSSHPHISHPLNNITVTIIIINCKLWVPVAGELIYGIITPYYKVF